MNVELLLEDIAISVNRYCRTPEAAEYCLNEIKDSLAWHAKHQPSTLTDEEIDREFPMPKKPEFYTEGYGYEITMAEKQRGAARWARDKAQGVDLDVHKLAMELAMKLPEMKLFRTSEAEDLDVVYKEYSKILNSYLEQRNQQPKP